MKSIFKDNPQLIVAKDNESGARMTISINSRIRSKASGGMRVLPDVTDNEAVLLSKTMSLKYGFLGLPIGGAKSVVKINFPPKSKERINAFTNIGKQLAPVLSSGEYIPGFDIGTDLSDIKALLTGAGLGFNKNEWRKVTHKYTALGMLAAIENLYSLLNDSVNGKTLSIEGFGNVGRFLAEEGVKKGMKVVAISNEFGGLVNKNGFLVDELIKEQANLGDEFITKSKLGEKIDSKEIPFVLCDIFAPCARFNPINEDNYSKVKAKVICVGHNEAVSYKTKHLLHRNKIFYIPGFIANGGGVLGAQLNEFFTDEEISEIIKVNFGKKLSECFSLSIKHNVPIEDVGASISSKNFLRVKQIEENKSIITRAITFGVGKMPRSIKKIFVQNKLRQLNFN